MNNSLKTVLLLGLLSGLLLGIGELLGGSQGLVFAFGIAVVMNFISYWFSDKIVLKMYRAQQVGPDHPLSTITRRLATRANLRFEVYVIPAAFRGVLHRAVIPASRVAATEDHAAANDQELEGVIAHELAHVKHRDILISSVAATVAAAIMMAARMAQYAAIFGGAGSRDDREGTNPIALIATIIFAPMAAMLVQAAISRSREFVADAGGARIAGSPHGLINALRKLEMGSKRFRSMQPGDRAPCSHQAVFGGVCSQFSTHPPRRIARRADERAPPSTEKVPWHARPATRPRRAILFIPLRTP